jgi:hypothetical protein
MKTKIVKIKAAKNITDRLAGIALFRVTGRNLAGVRINTQFEGTRAQAELWAAGIMSKGDPDWMPDTNNV